ncbi:single-stranded DNA-binding protein [Candidatus Falkowbacteria bacterium CG_4_10_14_0_2_um_filter_48_10]|uniref:Single-stranded DNA-binding protein n=1 Tax=Candidatus Falkowbacteria bacterium CG23_combo_of_CG06-09_8_20_14_all_49_15 TaxID=1974572 RepID=A0A2G9ZM02_9BACT|nr:MAG: single-stranded DNA-binding protein [Candidatus Falkowbacteria bacterium CG23_combo_of_CG06-09_8_20_14_all_49_15]PJA09442.1 MAG: single-stranded DNA-binding protein [Candidatus Falkowbacteria bacterium CG_4_10_14_0_2_um_filter_48_10]
MNLNKAMIIGNLTRDPEMRTTPSGINVTSFSVATNYVWKDQSGQKQEKAEYHNCIAWRRLGEIAGQYLRRGAKVFVEGRLQTRDWVGPDGGKRYRTEIIAENLIMLDRAGASQGPREDEQPPLPSEEPVINVQSNAGGPADNPAEEEIKVENIPF